jgi:hypothetical protein
MDPVINKLNTTLPDSPSPETVEQRGKPGASKFDKIRSQLKDNAGPSAASNSAASHVPDPDRADRRAPVIPSDRVQKSLSASQYHLARLKARVESMPAADSMSSLQSRLASIEKQYARLDATAKAMPPNAGPQQWIALQQQVYSMNESIGVLSKMVSQAASGVKTVLQTQV